MKRTISALSLAAAFASVATLGAQNSPAGGQEQRSTATARSSSSDMSITGCLAKDARGNYMLNNASGSPAGSSATATAAPPAAGAPAASASASSPSSSSAKMTWRLNGNEADLDKHVGHQIQVTGTAATSASASTTGESPAAPPASAANQPPASATGTSGVSASASQSLNVKTVTMIAASCS